MKKLRIILIAALSILALFGCASGPAPRALKDGVYTAEGAGHNGPVTVQTTIKGGKIAGVVVVKHAETPGIFEAAIDKVPAEIVKRQSLSIDAVSGATYMSNAIVEAVGKCVAQAGGDPATLQAKVAAAAATAKAGGEEKLSCDIVVVGAGASGHAAALEAVNKGAKVIMLEKLPIIGGAGNYMEGYFGVETPMQKAQGVKMTQGSAFTDDMLYNHWVANGRLTRKWINKTPETFDWLQNLGVKFVVLVNVDGVPALHIYDGGNGSGVIKIMDDKFKAKGGILMTETPAKSLIVDKSGAVSGVVAQRADGTKLTISAKAVILATGGFTNNKDMLKKYGINPDEPLLGPAKGRDGDGINMGLAVGGTVVNMQVYQGLGIITAGIDPNKAWYPIKGDPNGKAYQSLYVLQRQPFLWVGKDGRRFVDESVNWLFTQNAAATTGNDYQFFVMDQDTKDDLVSGHGIVTTMNGDTHEGDKLAALDQGIEIGKKLGSVYVAASIADLAKQMGVSVENLTKQVEVYNASSAAGSDSEFGKKAEYLRPVLKAPFYAFKGIQVNNVTCGGLAVNDDLRVIDAKHAAIAGLYAIGNDTGSIYGDTYGVSLPGSTSSFAINSGRMAAEDAVARYVKQ